MKSSTTSILIGGLSVAIIGALIAIGSQAAGQGPIGILWGCLSCIVMLSSGFIAVWHYTGEHQLTLTGGQGVKLGALAGLVGTLVGWSLQQLLMLMGVLSTPEEAMDQAMRDSGADMEAMEGMLSFMEMFTNPLFGLLVGLVIGPLLGLAGGAIGAAVFKRGNDEPEVNQKGE